MEGRGGTAACSRAGLDADACLEEDWMSIACAAGGAAGGAGDVIARAAGRFGRGGETGEGEEGINLAERLRMLVDNFEPVEAQDLNRLVELQMDASAQVLRRWVHS